MKIKCISDKVNTNGLTINKIYEIISIIDLGGTLFEIIDDNGDNKRYSEDFFILCTE